MTTQRSLARHSANRYPGYPRLGDLFEQFLEEMHDYEDSTGVFTRTEAPEVDIRETKKAVVVEAVVTENKSLRHLQGWRVDCFASEKEGIAAAIPQNSGRIRMIGHLSRSARSE